MRLLDVATLLTVPFLASAAPLENVKNTKGYQMGVFYVNWVIRCRLI